ncbi:MAG TPA: hypothetical protein VMB52_00440 [Verrucomicrobiae bacterium]|nr:hypothetical protein [Verrucomicrobiae bacterium]
MNKAVRERRHAFKGRLLKLVEQMHKTTDGPLRFKSQGNVLDPESYLDNVITPTKQLLPKLSEDISSLVTGQDWSLDTKDNVAAFTKLVQLLDGALTKVSDLLDVVPPVEWRATYRELTHAFTFGVRGHVFTALALIDQDHDELTKTLGEANTAFAEARIHTERAEQVISLASRLSSTGPFQADGSLDVAILAWSGAANEATTIAKGADIARKAYADINGVSSLPDERAVALLPTLALGSRVIDYTWVVEVANGLRTVLDNPKGTSWIVNPTLLVDRILEGQDRVLDYSERLGREWRNELPAHHIMLTLTEGYRELVEGALKDLAAPIIIAERAQKSDANATYEEDVVDGIKAGEIVEGLERLAPLSNDSVEMTFRNASAHAGIKVTDSGVTAKAYRTEDGRVVAGSRRVISLSAADFLEEVIELQELLFALQLAVLPWLWTTADPSIKKSVDEKEPTPRQRDYTVALLAGLAGLYDTVLDSDGSEATLKAKQQPETLGQPNEISILSLVPAIFSLSPDIKRATINIQGRKPTTFERIEFIDSQGDLIAQPVLNGITMAKWILLSEGKWLEKDEAVLIVIPLVKFVIDELGALIVRQPYTAKNVQDAVKRWEVVRTRLEEISPIAEYGVATEQTVELIDAFFRSVSDMAKYRSLGDKSSTQTHAKQATTTLNKLDGLRQRVVAQHRL